MLRPRSTLAVHVSWLPLLGLCTGSELECTERIGKSAAASEKVACAGHQGGLCVQACPQQDEPKLHGEYSDMSQLLRGIVYHSCKFSLAVRQSHTCCFIPGSVFAESILARLPGVHLDMLVA